ncbi:MAG: Fic family protein [Firmicutes bacterium]|nr:Fic family protein [Bacillota bacterium]
MREFNFKETYNKLLTPEIVALLTDIHELKGEQNVVTSMKSDVLEHLIEIAKIQSTDASNRIEGIVTTRERIKKLVMDKTAPKNRSEEEIAGYRDVLATIHESYEYIPLTPSMILQLHRDLYKFRFGEEGGVFKSSDNVIAEEHPDGTETVRFAPLSAWETPEAISNLCDAYQRASRESELDDLLLIPIFILDFLCIHPFNDGNGRMSRLLTLLLLYRSGYDVGKYISIEKIIADSKETYYEVLQDSSFNWHEGSNDYLPFARYLLGTVIAAYRELKSRTALIENKELSKPGQVREVIKNNLGTITKTELMERCPGISQVTIQRALADMLDKNEIIKISGGRYTKYAWNQDKE